MLIVGIGIGIPYTVSPTASPSPVGDGNPIGLLLALTYEV